MPKAIMATSQTVFSLGIILLLLGNFPSSEADIEQPGNDINDGKKNVDGVSPNAVKPDVEKEVDTRGRSEDLAQKEGNPINAGYNSRDTDNDVKGEKEDPREQKQGKGDRFFGGKNQKLGSDDSPCAEDISQLCHEVPKGNNFALLVCLQDKAEEDDLNPECHHMLWDFKRTVSQDPKFETTAERFCKDDLEHLSECAHVPRGASKLIPCLMEHRQNITNVKCKHLITKLQVIIFSDYRLIEGFLRDCTEDVSVRKCGRLQTDEEEEDIHSQNDVLECLEDHQGELLPECQKQIFRLAELSSDDYHLDRPLYYACLGDREKFCADIASGEGRVYACLKKHKFEETMSKECRQSLTVRQKLEARDPKANYPLMKNCMTFYRQYKDDYNCEKPGKTRHGALASILICLEKAIEDGQKVSGQCQAELFDLKQQLMEDYEINPSIVAVCDVEIAQHCHHGAEREGKTLDCLMTLAEEDEGVEKKMSSKCFDAIKELLSETGAGSDYRIDHTLYVACEPVVQTTCKDKGKKEGDISILSCLMEHMHTDVMNPECEQQLLHLEFFISRDFSLDPVLEQACHDDARNVCFASKVDDQDTYPASMILSCLYRNSMAGAEAKVSAKCAAHVRRVMHQRAIDVHLLPEVQLACMVDLGQYCSEKVAKGEEIECLQDNFDKLSSDCRNAIGNFTEEEGEDFQLDKKLVRACSGMVTKFCEDVVSRGETEEVLPCLVEHKNDAEMDEKCHVAIEHWQLIEMKDFRFSPEIKRACKRDAEKYCRKAQSKHELIVCLSGKIRDAVIDEKEHEVSAQCRKQLRIEKEVEGENLQFDPVMLVACVHDVARLCSHVNYGQAKMLECLRKKRADLSEACKGKLFEREKEEMRDPEIDYKLRKSCHKMIRLFCDDVPPSEQFYCLKKHKNSEDMEPNCREVIIRRQIRQSQDVRLDPQLGAFCKLDIPKFCKSIPEGQGKIVECLKNKRDKLSEECEGYIKKLIIEGAHDYRLDARLAKECATEITTYCSEEEPSVVEECLRKHLGSIERQQCRIEIVRFMKDGRTDVQADPVLYRACALDINRHCSEIPFGRGQVIKCLLEARESDRGRFGKECLIQLTSRMRMWEIAAKVVPPETIGDLAVAISASPSKNYFLIIFATCLALIFVGGLVFGRLSKRIRREVKDR